MDFYVLGEEEIVIGFQFVGVSGTVVTTEDDARTAFRKITGQATVTTENLPGCRILIVTEDVANLLGDEIVDWQYSGRYPLIVEVPGFAGHLKGRKTLVDSIREAIGIQV